MDNLLVISPFLLTELDRVLRYPRVRRIHGLSDEEIEAFVTEIDAGSEAAPISPGKTGTAIASDPDDNLVIRTAVTGKARVLCTRDRHLQTPKVRTHCNKKGIRILTDVGLLRLLRQKQRR